MEKNQEVTTSCFSTVEFYQNRYFFQTVHCLKISNFCDLTMNVSAKRSYSCPLCYSCNVFVANFLNFYSLHNFLTGVTHFSDCNRKVISLA